MSTFDLVLLFSPQNCSLELLEANLTSKRRELADSVVARIKDAAKQRAGRYDLLIGPRGTGKSHVLAYIEQVLRRDVGDGLRIVHLSEEEFGIGTMLDFLVACLQAAHVPLDPLYDELRGPKALEIAEEAFLACLETTPSLLVVENFALVLDAMDTGEQRRLRTFLQSNPHISVLASSPWLFGDSDKPDHPFHGFFLIEPLDSLTRVQARDYLIQLAKWKGDEDLVNELRAETAQARVNAIHDLTGGNHRLLGMLSECLRADDLQTLVEPFVRLVDRELTPYYQQRLGRLAAQPYKILKTLARQQGATPVKAIARLCFITEQTASGQLRVLKEAGLVRSEQLGRESYYEIREPLLRFVLDIKEGRERLLPSMVALLRDWYSSNELAELSSNSVGFAREYFRQALYEKSSPNLTVNPGEALSKSSRESSTSVIAAEGVLESNLPKRLMRWMHRARELHDSGDYVREVGLYEQIHRRYCSSRSQIIQVELAKSLVDRALALALLNRHHDALDSLDTAESRFRAANSDGIQRQIGRAILVRAGILETLGELQEALRYYDEYIQSSDYSIVGADAKYLAWTLVHKADTLRKLGRGEEAIEAYDEITRRWSASGEIKVLLLVARAQVARAETILALGHHERALKMYEELCETFGNSSVPQLRIIVATALIAMGIFLENINRPQDALLAYCKVENKYGDIQDSELQAHVVQALLLTALNLHCSERTKESLEVLEAILNRLSRFEVPKTEAVVASVQLMRAHTLRSLGHWQKAAYIFSRIDFVKLDPAIDLPSSLIANGIDICRQDLESLRRVLRRWPVPDAVVAGLTEWVQALLPLTKSEALEMELSERNLHAAFAQTPEAMPMLDVLSAARAYSLGDSKALLRLPLEARRLVERAYGIATEE